MSERNKALVRKIYQATETGDAAILDSAVTEEVIEHPLNPDQPPGREALKQIRDVRVVTLSDRSY